MGQHTLVENNCKSNNAAPDHYTSATTKLTFVWWFETITNTKKQKEKKSVREQNFFIPLYLSGMVKGEKFWPLLAAAWGLNNSLYLHPVPSPLPAWLSVLPGCVVRSDGRSSTWVITWDREVRTDHDNTGIYFFLASAYERTLLFILVKGKYFRSLTRFSCFLNCPIWIFCIFLLSVLEN